ncbi:hypothetical protein H4R33_006395 [Dimargaris cristalligena]|nr:hypothetical protein H4R33_006395 [Dimargaris cristalligena]
MPLSSVVWQISTLAFFSICGVWIRLGVLNLFDFANTDVFPLALVQLLGCLVMGFIRKLKTVQARANDERHYVEQLRRERIVGAAANGANENDHADGHSGTCNARNWHSFEYHLTHHPYLFTGITTGLCGSITTFSSWQLDIFQTAFRIPTRLPTTTSAIDLEQARLPPTHFDSLLASFNNIVVTWCVAIAGFWFGSHVARAWLALRRWRLHCARVEYMRGIDVGSTTEAAPATRFPPLNSGSPQSSRGKRAVQILAWTIAGLGLFGWIGVIVGTSLKFHWRNYNFAACFAPLGTLIRYGLARFNHLSTSSSPPTYTATAPPSLRVRRWVRQLRSLVFPWGTFTANILGTAILAVLFILGRNVFRINAAAAAQEDQYRTHAFCQFRQALIDGLCGCLTTISTLVVEVAVLLPSLRLSYIYALASLLVAQIFMVFIAGFYEWFAQPDTRVGYLNCTL